MCDVPHLATARRTAALAAVGLVLATTGCGGGPESAAPATTAAGPTAGASGGPTQLPTFDPSSAVGTYAEGFPADLFPLPKDATLLASSAKPASTTKEKGAKDTKTEGVQMTQVTLNLSSGQPTKKLMGQIKQILVDDGFRAVSAPDSSGLTAQTAFLRISKTKDGEIQESLVVGVLDDGERRLASISGTVRSP